MRLVAIVLTAVTSAAVAGCSGAGSTSVAGGPVSAKPVRTAATVPTVRAASPIEGTWRSGKLTEPEFVRWYKAAGGKAEDGSGNPFPSVTAAGKAFFAQLGNGARRYAVITLRFQSGQFAEFESGDGKPAVNGDTETYTISGDRLNLVGTGPFGTCNATYTFRVTGRQLRLHLIKQCAMGWFGTTLYASFPFTKVS